MLTPNYFIEQIIKASSIQNELALAFQSFIRSESINYCTYSQDKHAKFNQEIQSLLFNIIRQCEDRFESS